MSDAKRKPLFDYCTHVLQKKEKNTYDYTYVHMYTVQ